MQARIERIDTPRGRLIATSDIHGNLKLFEELLDLIRLTDNDVLIIVGDMCERCENSLGVIRRAMGLTARGNTHVLVGNKDLRAIEYVTGTNGRVGSVVTDYVEGMREWGCNTLFTDMCREAGIPYSADMDVAAAQRILSSCFAREIAFIRSLPTFIETPQYIFVHGGVPSGELTLYEGMDADIFTDWDNFITEGIRFDKYAIVGHTPAELYRSDYSSNAPFICRAQHIIDIDGGVGIKFNAQLNAIILPTGGDDFSWISAHGVGACYALDTQPPSRDPINLRWMHNDVEILSQHNDIAHVRHIETGKEMYVPLSFLFDLLAESARVGRCLCVVFSDFELPIEVGDELRIYCSTSRGYIAKKGDITGWYMGRISDVKP